MRIIDSALSISYVPLFFFLNITVEIISLQSMFVMPYPCIPCHLCIIIVTIN